jgi:hypothetical protein
MIFRPPCAETLVGAPWWAFTNRRFSSFLAGSRGFSSLFLPKDGRIFEKKAIFSSLEF